MELKDSTYFVTYSWMTNKLNLKTVERDVFAIIYGFCQDGTSDFHGSLSYMATLTGYSRNSICTALKNLTDKRLLNKDEKITNNIKYCSYTINFDSIQATCTGIQATCINNKANNKEQLSTSVDNINKNFEKSDFIGSAKKKKKTSLYSRCISQIDNYIVVNHCPGIRDLLIRHLDIAFESKSIRGEKQYIGILNKLNQLCTSGDKYGEVISYSIEHGYPTFYSQKSNYKKKTTSALSSESGKRHVESFTKEDEKRLNEFQKECKKKGIRTTF